MQNEHTTPNTTNKSKPSYSEIYRPFRYKVSPELREYLDKLKADTKARLRVQKGLLDFARTHLQVARLFQADTHKDAPESTRYWAERSATKSLELLCWCVAGRPAIGDAPRTSYEAYLRFMGYPLPEMVWFGLGCSTKEGAAVVIDTAANLMELAKAEMHRTTGEA